MTTTQRTRLKRQQTTRRNIEANRRAKQRPHLARMARNALDRAKKITGADLKTAVLLGVPPSHICDYRKGRRTVEPRAAAELANLLNEDVIQAIALALAFSTSSTSSRRFWLDFASGLWPHQRRIYERWAEDRFAKKYPIR